MISGDNGKMKLALDIKTIKDSTLEEKIGRLNKILSQCTLCPRRCKVNRIEGQRGFCGGGKTACVSSAFPHFGEESCLVGINGSGTIFFSYCNLRCVFCQNYEISHLAFMTISAESIASYRSLH